MPRVAEQVPTSAGARVSINFPGFEGRTGVVRAPGHPYRSKYRMVALDAADASHGQWGILLTEDEFEVIDS